MPDHGSTRSSFDRPLATPPIVTPKASLAMQEPLTALAIIGPLALVGEAMRLLGGGGAQRGELLADPLMVELGKLVGLHLPFVPILVLVVWWLIAQIGGKHAWRTPPLSALALALMWGGIWALTRCAVAFTCGNILPDSMVGYGGRLISGAVQEELLFRGVVLGLAIAIVRLYDWPGWVLGAVALPLSAIFFSLAHTTVVNHHPGAELFTWSAFIERSLAGAIYGYAFLRQGLGVATLAHLGYLLALEAGFARFV